MTPASAAKDALAHIRVSSQLHRSIRQLQNAPSALEKPPGDPWHTAAGEVAAYVFAESRYGDPASLQAHPRATKSGRAPGETMRPPERLKVIHEARREPEGAARSPQGYVRLRAR